MREDDLQPVDSRDLRSSFSDDPEMRALLAFFLGDLDRRIGSIRRALDEADLAGLRTLAHQLSGSAGGYGYPSIGDAARALEHGLPRPARGGAAPSPDIRRCDGLADEMEISAVAERAESLIALCRDAIRAGRREGFAWGIAGELAPSASDDPVSDDEDPFGFDDRGGDR
jgi:HPt (histidine-containing phosphotransfer) domain-containing protein